MNIAKKLLISSALSVIFTGCSDSEMPKQTRAEHAPQNTQPKVNEIPAHAVKGILRGSEFKIEQARLENGTLTLRQGKDFFADKSLDIIIFENDPLDNKTIKVDSNTGFDSPHLRLNIKEDNANLPDTKMLMSGYEMELSFGKADELGIPFAIRLLVNDETKTDIKGRFFASFKDVRIEQGQVDLSYDSFDTLEYLTRQYLQTKYQDIQWQERISASYSGSENSNYPKAGFIAYEVSIAGAPSSTVKVQLYKDENGWRVSKQLTENQIAQAHPVTEYIITNKRDLRSQAVKVAAALSLENDLNKQGLMPKIRSSSINCHLARNADKASCQLIYKIREAEDVICMSKNYLLVQTDQKWHVEKEILETEKIDSTSGKLVTYKPGMLSMSCN